MKTIELEVFWEREMEDRSKQWFQNDELHRETGPAYVCGDGYSEWWRNDSPVDELNENN